MQVASSGCIFRLFFRPAMSSIINIAAYKFAELSDLKPLREELLRNCKAWNLKGTILLSTEGINLFVAGERDSVELLLSVLRAIPGLESLAVKISASERQPFTRMLVRIKKEIIAFGVDGIDPARSPSPKLSPRELKQWLDEGRPVTLLDTRNEYEVKLGTFQNAVNIGIDHFRDFPAAVSRLPSQLKQQPIVMFCTGGIRCEKAGPFMQREGFEQIYQLDGGILKYFEDVGGDHYQGECFVFDQRVGLDPNLSETESDQCYACLTPLTEEDLRDPRFQKAVSCPYCYATDEQQRARTLAKRREQLLAATTPLPGSEPYDNQRPLVVPSACDGLSLLDFLCTILKHVPREEWAAIIAAGRVRTRLEEPVTSEHIVRAGERYLHLIPATREPDVNPHIEIIHEDEAIVVLNKPAPLPLHPSGRFNRNTLQSILHTVYTPQVPRPAHRLDANTSGIVVFARTRHFAGLLQPQFERGEVEKVYLARVQGHPPEDNFRCNLPISDSAGELGSRTIDAAGLAADTEFRVLERFADGTSLLEARPITGRTNQIRVHLWQLGWPICGEQTYLPGGKLGDTQTHAMTDPPLCLHSSRLSFVHPLSRQRLEFTAPAPTWTSY
ncbi:Ribosomal large subunit pseudouridine synthase A [Anatilimnocola aggregata]|uniref:tRNA uridine(34) hydroxylase n=1 Tax=Anatilimnocola aggregata TaxID=2528021 RepID=A0A517YDX5_9BACT|nr:RluA family pseudouridine synthase [Anatilimnocola aggregata]QDU28435.1 Ribosomal large subunit pseudouridine synthase A [Anatilimnocola aggregata]